MRPTCGVLLATLLAVTWPSVLTAVPNPPVLRIHEDGTITSKLHRVPLHEVAAMLEAELGARVHWSESLNRRPVTLRATRMHVDRFLSGLAPRVFVDAEAAAPDDVVAVYLRDLDDPPLGTVIPGISTSTVVLFEGDTEQGATDVPDDVELVVRDGRVTLRASKQPLSVVAYRVAEAVGIPFDFQYALDDLVDVAVTDVPLASAVRAISPRLRLYVRTDLQSRKTTPLRLVWHAP